MSEFNALRTDLADLADEVRMVDLRDRSLAVSRRIRNRRAVVGSSLAVALVVAGVAFVARPGRHEALPPVAPTVTQAPTPEPTATVPSGITPSLGPWSAEEANSLPGTTFFLLTADGSSPDSWLIGVGILGDGQVRTRWFGEMPRANCLGTTLSISPDGGQIAWLVGDAGGAGGELMVASLSGGAPRRLAGPIGCGNRPYWLPDSRSVAVFTPDRGFGRIDVETGAFAPLPERFAGYVAWAANGEYVAYGDRGAIVVETAGGTVKYRVPYDIGCCTGGFSVQGVSIDGRYVGVNYAPSDPGGVRGTMRVIDLTTGREIALPGVSSGQTLSDVLFSGDGLLVQTRSTDGTGTLHLVTAGQRDPQTLTQSGEIKNALAWLYVSPPR